MLRSVSADVKQATIVQVKFQKWLSKIKVIGTKKRLNSRAETKSEARCVKSAPVNPENISGQRNYNRRRRSSLHLTLFCKMLDTRSHSDKVYAV